MTQSDLAHMSLKLVNFVLALFKQDLFPVLYIHISFHKQWWAVLFLLHLQTFVAIRCVTFSSCNLSSNLRSIERNPLVRPAPRSYITPLVPLAGLIGAKAAYRADPLYSYTVETLYNTVNFCWSTHKRHSIARPKGEVWGVFCEFKRQHIV